MPRKPFLPNPDRVQKLLSTTLPIGIETDDDTIRAIFSSHFAPEQTALILGCSTRTLHKLRNAKKISCMSLGIGTGATIRYGARDILNYVQMATS
jgi:hypothetical protein